VPPFPPPPPPGPRQPAPARLPFVDALKALASQLIVLHHLALYGPMSDVVGPWSLGLVDALDAYGRLAVQVFLVLGGFLSARALAPDGAARFAAPGPLLARRAWRLAAPCWAAIALAIACAAIARQWANLPHTPAAPGAMQLLANLLMLQDVVGVEALSAGLWYVAIDLQLYALFVLVLWLAARTGRPAAAPFAVVAGVAVSLLLLNRDASWDAWAPYFFGSYGLGALAWWTSRSERAGWAAAGIAALGIVALAVEFRWRIALALVTALALARVSCSGALRRWPASRLLGFLGRISYSVFLAHYPVSLLFNAAWARWFPQSALANLAGLLLAWAASIGAGALLYRWVEDRSRPAPASTPAAADRRHAAD